MRFSFSVLVTTGLAPTFLPTLNTRWWMPRRHTAKAGRPVTLTNGGLALTLPTGVEFVKASIFSKARGDSFQLTETGQVITWAGISLAPRKTLKVRVKGPW